MYQEYSRGVSRKPQRPKSPIHYGRATTHSCVSGRACTREELLPVGLPQHWNSEVLQWNTQQLRTETEKRRRRSPSDKKRVRGDERRAASKGPYPSYSRTSRVRPSSSTINVARKIGAKIRTSHGRKRAQVDLASDEEILDAGSQISGMHSQYTRIIRTPAPPCHLHSRRSGPYPHSDLAGPFGYDRGSISGYHSVTPACPIPPSSENSRAHLRERSISTFYDDLTSCVRSLLKWGWRLWSVYSNARQHKQPTTPFRIDIIHAKNDGRELLEDLDVPCASDTSSDSSWDERSDDSLEEIEVEAELFSPLNDDAIHDQGCGYFDVEGGRNFWLQEHVPCETLSGVIQPDWHFISPEPDDPLPLPLNYNYSASVVSEDITDKQHELASTWAREVTEALGADGDLTISPDLSGGRALLSDRKLPTWRQYRFTAAKHEVRGSAERKVPVRYRDEAAVEAQRLQAESDAGTLVLEWGGFDQEVLRQCWS